MRYILAIPGIKQDPEDQNQWAIRAMPHLEALCPDVRADNFLYHVYGSTRFLEQDEHVKSVAGRLLTRRTLLPDEEVTVVAHSNGCAMICQALRDYPFHVHNLHLVAAAEHADFRKNGLLDALAFGQIGHVTVYWSEGDTVLSGLATWSRKLFGRWGLGYGSLGFEGPKGVPDWERDVVTEVRDDSMGHSTWFEGDNFQKTLRRVCGLTIEGGQ